ncbi:hypothetical protein F5Y10DRAFT_238112 [Nemania abortiva]|nr:hypothetical protein F5Y10DRAFT_238112 [Nemania abortiva]
MSEPPIHRAIQPLSQPPLLSPRERHSITTLREARLHSPWKRSACDRCRSLKLKCKRDNENTTQSCVRCIRADATCFTSSAKSSARLAQAQSNAKFTSPTSPPTRANTNTDIAGIRCRRESLSPVPVMQINSDSAGNQESTFLMRWPFSHQGEQAATLDIDFDVGMPSPTDESGQANYFDSPVETSEPPFHLDHLSPTSTPMTSALPLDLPSELFSGTDGVISHLTSSYSIETDTPSPAIGDEVNPGILLADLQQCLSKQLVALETKPWDLTTLSITSSATATGGSEQEICQGGFNPVASILASTSEFVSILRLLRKPVPNPSMTTMQEYRQSHEGSQHYIGWPTPVPSIQSRDTYPSALVLGSASVITSPSRKVQGRVHLLTTINCYFLVLSIFDGIFSRLLACSEEARPQVSTNDHASSPSPLSSSHNPSLRNSRPELLFAGHSVTLNARLRTRLLVQVVEHQLEILEHDLGLPQQYCVSSTRADDAGSKPAEDGILGRRESLLLLQTVMGWTADTDESGSFHRGEEMGRSPVTSSLIDKLKRAQRAPTRR